MCNQLTEFKTLLKILPLEEQISEINDKIIEVRNEKCPKHLYNHAYDVIKKLKQMRQIARNCLNNTNLILQQ